MIDGEIVEMTPIGERHALSVIYLNNGPTGYRDVQRLGCGASVSPAAFPDLRLAVDAILGPAR